MSARFDFTRFHEVVFSILLCDSNSRSELCRDRGAWHRFSKAFPLNGRTGLKRRQYPFELDVQSGRCDPCQIAWTFSLVVSSLGIWESKIDWLIESWRPNQSEIVAE